MNPMSLRAAEVSTGAARPGSGPRSTVPGWYRRSRSSVGAGGRVGREPGGAREQPFLEAAHAGNLLLPMTPGPCVDVWRADRR